MKGAIRILAVGIGLLFTSGAILISREAARKNSHHERHIRFEDERCLSVSCFRYAPEGIILFVQVKSPVIKVQQLGQPSEVIPHKSLVAQSTGELLILVPYNFVPRREWGLELYSEDRHWISMSPYFPRVPDLSSAEWNRLWSVAPGTKVELR